MFKKIMLIFLLVLSPCIVNATMRLAETSFQNLPGWHEDNHAQALQTFQRSCDEIDMRRSVAAKNWQTICRAARSLPHPDAHMARQFFEKWFTPFRVSNNYQHIGLFTGYYLPLLHVRKKPNKKFNVPVHGLPNDWVKVDLGLFMPQLSGKYVTGQMKNNALFPYPRRETILQDKNRKNANVLFWSDNPVDVYFAQVQGSALVQLPNKKNLLIGYAGGNGRAYTSIGKILVDNNELDKESLSMQTIRQWLAQHPKQMHQLLNQNASYVFFRLLSHEQPLGTEQVPLTPGRTLAIDTHFIPLGAPIWLNSSIPGGSKAFRRLLIAQDTGGAIRGVVRGDIYWGAGKRAEYLAGHMNSPGEYWILLPRR